MALSNSDNAARPNIVARSNGKESVIATVAAGPAPTGALFVRNRYTQYKLRPGWATSPIPICSRLGSLNGRNIGWRSRPRENRIGKYLGRFSNRAVNSTDGPGFGLKRLSLFMGKYRNKNDYD
ncbi:MAG: hypothetical protein CM1200mP27_11400 [Chloroflexota bacterium]|nr:MAG: hypothetical protein CM1200mP27_11400 [Chloroflexota bacterium]